MPHGSIPLVGLALEARCLALLGALTFPAHLGVSAQSEPIAYHLGMPQAESLPPARSMSGQDGRTIVPQDILGFREVTELRISPDGRRVAYAVREARVGTNDYSLTLYVVDYDRHQVPRKLAASSAIANVRWNPDGRRLTYLGRDGATTGLFQYDIAAARRKRLRVPTTGPIEQYEWSPDGTGLLLVAGDK